MFPLTGHFLTDRDLVLERLPLEDVSEAWKLEVEGFPPDEAASEDSIRLRCQEAGEHFWGIYDVTEDQNRCLIGFINGTRVKGEKLTEETMHGHDPSGTTLCIHSVVTTVPLRRKRVASAALRAYIRAHKNEQQIGTCIDLMLLISKAKMLPLYVGAGFQVYGPSPVVHGQDLWFDCGLNLAVEKQLDFVQVDTFSKEPFKGNPASVVFCEDPLEESLMQSIANEFNLAETAFVSPYGPFSGSEFQLRWFTPTAEVDLCGHATLAAAKGLWATKRTDARTLNFHTKSGVLKAWKETDGSISMDFPLEEATPCPAEEKASVANALGISPAEVIFIGQNRLDKLVHISSEAFSTMQPNLALISEAPVRGFIVTARSEDLAYHFKSRFFGPRLGIDEDAVTGSAHCALTPYWAAILKVSELNAFQASKRTGSLNVALIEETSRVKISGSSFIVMSGKVCARAQVSKS